MKFAPLYADMDGGWDLLVYPIAIFSLHLSGRSNDMTDILWTGTLGLNSIIQTKFKPLARFSCDRANIFNEILHM